MNVSPVDPADAEDTDTDVALQPQSDATEILESESDLAPDVETSDEPVETKADVAQITYEQVDPVAVVRLSYPFEIDGIQVSEVGFRHPSFSSIEAVLAGVMSELDLHASMTNLPVAALRALRWPDLELVSVIARHMAPALKSV